MNPDVQLLDPVEFLQPHRRLFIDTNIFMHADEGALKRLFERGQSAILANSNPVVVPTKVVRELAQQSRRHPASADEAEAIKEADAIKKAGNALAFLESASKVGLIRKDLGHITNPYADDLFLLLLDRFSDTYEMCLLTDDITVRLRVRLLAHQRAKRLLAGVLTRDGDLEVESDQALFERGVRKYARYLARVADGRGKSKDKSEVETLKNLLPAFSKAFGLQDPDVKLEAGSLKQPFPRIEPSPDAQLQAPGPAFSSSAALRPRDTPLTFSAIPKEGDRVTWESRDNRGSLTLGSLLGEGGEGSVYEGDRNTVVKVFDKSHLTRHRKEKIELLVSRGLRADGMCVPSAVVTNHLGEFVGYVMPRASGREFQRTIFNKRKFENEYPHWKKADLVEVCVAFLEKVKYLHSMNIILGDINPKNLMVDDKKNVFIIDADSWQLEGYPCPVGTPMFTSPAMLGKTYADDLRTTDDELFSVATMLFMIVMTGQFPYIRTGTDGDMVQLIREGNFAFQYENRNNKDQPGGDWKYMWSHIHKPVKDLFWHTFHREGKRYSNRPEVAEWLTAFTAYKEYLGNTRTNFDPMSNDVYPIRNKAFKPDTPIHDCPICGRKNAIAGIWMDDAEEYSVPRQCNKCREHQPSRTVAPRPVTSRPLTSQSSPSATYACKECRKTVPKTQLTYGRCVSCTAKAALLDPTRLCADCRQPFLTKDHIGWFTKRSLEVPKSHSAIRQTCPPAKSAAQRASTQTGFWARVKQWFMVT